MKRLKNGINLILEQWIIPTTPAISRIYWLIALNIFHCKERHSLNILYQYCDLACYLKYSNYSISVVQKPRFRYRISANENIFTVLSIIPPTKRRLPYPLLRCDVFMISPFHTKIRMNRYRAKVEKPNQLRLLFGCRTRNRILALNKRHEAKSWNLMKKFAVHFAVQFTVMVRLN